MHGTDRTMRTGRTGIPGGRRRRTPLRTALALASAALLAGTTLTLTAPQAGASGTPGTAATAAAEDFQQVTLAKGAAEVGEPMSLAVLPDRSVLHTSRDGTLRLTRPAGPVPRARQPRPAARERRRRPAPPQLHPPRRR